jgi:hypothetical protein
VQEQAEGVGQEAVTAQAVGAETVLELLDAALTLAAIVVESEDLRGTGRLTDCQAPRTGARLAPSLLHAGLFCERRSTAT